MRYLQLGIVGLIPAILATACVTPPVKEMNQAQAALDAARAEGAHRYAGDEYTAAIDALRRSREAVSRRDYRLALNDALDSRDRAQTAARMAGEARSAMRREIEDVESEIAALMATARSRLAAARIARAPASLLLTVTSSMATVDDHLQKAGTSANAGDYQAAQRLLNAAKRRLHEAIGTLGQTSGVRQPVSTSRS